MGAEAAATATAARCSGLLRRLRGALGEAMALKEAGDDAGAARALRSPERAMEVLEIRDAGRTAWAQVDAATSDTRRARDDLEAAATRQQNLQCARQLMLRAAGRREADAAGELPGAAREAAERAEGDGSAHDGGGGDEAARGRQVREMQLELRERERLRQHQFQQNQGQPPSPARDRPPPGTYGGSPPLYIDTLLTQRCRCTPCIRNSVDSKQVS